MFAALTYTRAVCSDVECKYGVYHSLCYCDDLGEVANGRPELLLHVTEQEVAVAGREPP